MIWSLALLLLAPTVVSPQREGRARLDPGRDLVPLGAEVLDFDASGEGPIENGRELSTPWVPFRGVELRAVSASGLGACAFDSDPAGPNGLSSDPDLLVDRGNVLILQERPLQSAPGVFDFPDDDRNGGRVLFRFEGDRVAPLSIDLVDVCPEPDQAVRVVLYDENEFTRTFEVPAGWTEDVTQGGLGWRTLDLTTLEPQPGFASTATATEFWAFDEDAVLEIEVSFSGSGAIDRLAFVRGQRAAFNITGCSLSCDQLPPFAVTCGSSFSFVNRDLCFDFNMPVELSSVNSFSFQVVDNATGRTVPGTFFLDSRDDSLLCFRPSVSFDADGFPVFAFEEGGVYVLRIQGQAADPGPFVLSRFGDPVERFFSCTLLTTGVLDQQPGPPSVATTVDVVASYDAQGRPAEIASDQPAAGATQVFRGSPIRFRFDDLIVPATLLDPATGAFRNVLVGRVVDGPPAPVPGSFSVSLDFDEGTTELLFHPSGDLPEGRSVFVRFLPGILDFAGEELIDPGPIEFEVERRPAGRRRSL